MKRFKDFIEWQAFGVCAAIGERLGIATERIRMWFIYISFLTLGSPLIVYMVAAFLDEYEAVYFGSAAQSIEIPLV